MGDAQRRWSERNKERERKMKRAWAKKNPTKKAAANRAWHVANREKAQTQVRDWKKRNPEAMLKYRLKKYGLTLEKYRAMLADQGGACAICRCVPNGKTTLVVDHHHATDQHRKLLCVNCNAGLGNFREDPRRLMAAIDYLVAHGSPGILSEAA